MWVAADKFFLVAEAESIHVFDIDKWEVVARTHVGSALAQEIEGWNVAPCDAAAIERREAILQRLDGQSRLRSAMQAIAGEDAEIHARLMNRVGSFVNLTEGALELPGWHRGALAKHALFRQQYVAWGIPDANQLWPDVKMIVTDVENLAGNAGASEAIDINAIHVINDPALPRQFLDEFESFAPLNGIARIHVADDGEELRVGPTLIGAELGTWEPVEVSPGVPFARLTAAIIDRELIFANHRIAGALTQELSATLGRVFVMSWRDLSAREERTRN